MIDRDYCTLMARYNTWQNRQLTDALEVLPPEALTQDRGAFFGSILGTLNHLLWGDGMWMSRLDGGPAPSQAMAESTGLHPTLAAWSAERFRMDGRIHKWADGLRNVDLKGDLHWYSAILKADVTRPVGFCVVHMFNHQTHHRGQVHAMVTAADGAAPISDIFLMPEDA